MPRSVAKPSTTKEALLQKLSELVDKSYDGLNEEEIARSQKKLKAVGDRVRASRARRRETA